MPDLVTLGETCVALVAKSRGPLRHATEFERRPGGAESTVAAGVARLGHGAGWMSRLGRDEFGAYVLGLMRSEGVDTAAVRVDPHARTGVFFRDNRADGRSSVIYYRKHSAFAGFGPDDLDEDYIASARVLHLTGITPGLSPSCRAAVLRAVEIARANGVAIVFDPNYRAAVWPPEEARPCIEGLMRRADHVLAGREDLVKLTGLTEEGAQLDYLHGLGLPSVVLKLGARGAVLSGADGAERIEGYGAEPPFDRFGAGDAFAAGYICGLLDGRTRRGAVALGNAVAGWSVRLPGNIESLPDRNDLRQLESGHRFVDR